MIILPAIDIINGKPVRLVQGDFSRQEVVAADVVETARAFENQGAEFVHLVDLDGAKAGHPVNQEKIIAAAKALNIPVEVGGGIRTLKQVETYLEQGIARIILGTSALKDPKLLKTAVEKYPEQIAVGLDCKDGKVCLSGWLDVTSTDYLDFARYLADLGVKTIIFTDISKDGTLQGPNLDMLKKLQDTVNVNIIASGGIKDLSHIQALADMDLYGAITGKAMYAGTLDLPEAIAAGRKSC